MKATAQERRLGAAISDRTPAIVSAVMNGLKPADRTVAAKIVAARLVERCADAAAKADWTELPAWVDATCERYAGVFAADRVIEAGLERIWHAVEVAPAARVTLGFDAARAQVRTIVARPRPVAQAVAREVVDEVDVAIDDFLTRLDGSDVLTAEHSRAVSSWCARLAKRLGATKEQIVHLGRAGLIHDIGKMTTPSSILTAPRSLSDDEMAIMRKHAEDGAAIVRGVPLVANLEPAVRSHHERFDGSGYPDGLRWDAIPHTARVVAVADAFNAMIGRRPYRPPLAPSDALERLLAGRGEQFDPDIVDAMIDVVTNRV